MLTVACTTVTVCCVCRIDDSDGVYVVTGVKNRLVLSISESTHSLKTDKFYIVLVGDPQLPHYLTA